MHPAVTARCRTETNPERRASAPASRLVSLAQVWASLRKLFIAFALPLLAIAALPSLAADERPTGGRVQTVTRLVKLYLDREAALGGAIRSGDAAALENLLTD